MTSEDESTCKFVSSRGILKSCDIFSKTPMSSIRVFDGGYEVGFEKKIKDGDILYVCNSVIPLLSKHFHLIPAKIILVSGDSDRGCWYDMFQNESEFLQFIQNPKIIHWFSQNCLYLNCPKLSPIPIGLDYHTLSQKGTEWGPQASPYEQETELNNIIKTYAKPWNERIFQTTIYSNFHFSMKTRLAHERHDAIKKIPSECIFYEKEFLKRSESWKKQCDFVFVASPTGNGFDCHRTWEALVLGCIPIIKASHGDPLFKDLPVWIINDWSEVNTVNMIRVLNDFQSSSKTFNMKKITLDYWVDLIKSKRNLIE
uniref:Exostosin GT47 domain-containing protein n=1 Tax=viral metagenome TaxID=1070528 RepID=A0A6C0DP82_9ZZZZ